jgi:excisionase family DNA binding protein
MASTCGIKNYVETILEKLGRWPTRYMTIGEAASILGHHEQTLYKAARTGRFPVVRTFGSLRVDPASLAAWLRKRGA